MATVLSLKDQGNDEYKKENWLKAAALYTQAIKEDPQNAVLYSNRSAALLKLKKVTKALEDADTCIKLKPDWDKGYFRRGAVLEETDRLQEALEVYQHALTLAPGNKELNIKIRTLSKLLKIKVVQIEKQAAKEESLNAMIEAASGGPGAVADFVKELVENAIANIAEEETAFDPVVHFLPGPGAQQHEEQECNVIAKLAFAAPDMYGEFVGQMRAMGERFDARAAVAVVPRTAVAFPQVWSRRGWPFGKQAGVFVHVEAKGVMPHTVWFIPVADKAPGRPVPLDTNEFSILPPLLRQ